MIDHVPQGQELTDWINNHSKQRTGEFTGLKYGGEYYLDELRETIDEYESLDFPTDIKAKVTEILTHGSIDGNRIGLEDVNRNGYAELQERRYIAGMISAGGEMQEAAETIVEAGVCGFHATRSTALAGILEAGAMKTAERLNHEGALMITGEHIYQKVEGQSSISFSNLAHAKDTINQYAGSLQVKRYSIEEIVAKKEAELKELDAEITSPDNRSEGLANHEGKMIAKMRVFYNQEQQALEHIVKEPHSLFSALSRVNFPVVFGISAEAVMKREDERTTRHLLNGASDLGEFRPNGDEIFVEELPVVAVPREVIAPVKELFARFGYKDQKVIAIEALAA